MVQSSERFTSKDEEVIWKALKDEDDNYESLFACLGSSVALEATTTTFLFWNMHSTFVYIHTYLHTRIQMRLCVKCVFVCVYMYAHVCMYTNTPEGRRQCWQLQWLWPQPGSSSSDPWGYQQYHSPWSCPCTARILDCIVLSCGNFEYLVHLVAHVKLYV
jgi:hypothetical protein